MAARVEPTVMSSASLQDNVVVQFLVGLVVITAMFGGGGVGAVVVGSLGFPYADVVGVFLGSLLVFLAFAALYARSHDGRT